jgi:hypothetical protein
MKVVGCQPLPPGLTWYSFSEAESTPGHMELSGATEKKNQATPGMDPEIFRLVAQCLNHYATPLHLLHDAISQKPPRSCKNYKERGSE